MPITFAGNPVTLSGTPIQTGEQMPDFTVTTTELTDIQPMQEKGKKIILAVPSVDTGVCSLELSKFMNFMKGQDEVKVISVSMDLPFALSRWCQAEGNDILTTTTDYKNRDFQEKTGTRMEENGLLARAAFVTDEDGKVVYSEYVSEVASEPDYDAILKAAGLK